MRNGERLTLQRPCVLLGADAEARVTNMPTHGATRKRTVQVRTVQDKRRPCQYHSLVPEQGLHCCYRTLRKAPHFQLGALRGATQAQHHLHHTGVGV